MNGIIDKKIFSSSITEFDNSYQKFSNNHLPVYKEFYVESTDDAEFYGYYLAEMYRVPKLTRFHGCNGKEEVLREYKQYNGKKAGFIVDLDYLPFDKLKYEKVIVTSGYSMENFFFYNDGKNYNFMKVFKEYYPNYNTRVTKMNQYLNELMEYKNKYLLYYAFFKTCMEFSNNRRLMNNHIKIKDLIDCNDDINEIIKSEISNFEPAFRNIFKSKYDNNLELLKHSDFMMIRGHDIFDHLVDFLRKDGKTVKKSRILQLAYGMNMPSDFMNQISLSTSDNSNGE